ncbi:MAG TPA: hypothetical protein VFT29_07430, partial [Gemmatimonadaceae bacterium]|nr:hypothetical protein [Gemmatimonadaceae bacterium]
MRRLLFVLFAVAGVSCHEPAAPAKPPYLAILSKFTTAPGVVIDGKLRYTVKELSGTLGIDRTLTSNP